MVPLQSQWPCPLNSGRTQQSQTIYRMHHLAPHRTGDRGGGQLSIVLVGHPKLKNDLRRPKMEEIGDRTTVFEFGGLRDQQRDYIDWVLKASFKEGVAPDDVLTDEAATLLAAKLKTPLQIGQPPVRPFEAGVGVGGQPDGPPP